MKKKLYKILTVCLCFMFIFFAGCSDGGLGTSDGSGDTSMGEPPKSLDGVKALMKPEDYSFSELVGGNSEYYYNLFAGYVMDNLIEVYSYMYDNLSDSKSEDYNQVLNGTNLINLITGSNDQTDDNIKFYYDSVRYSITNISTLYQDTENGNNLIGVRLTLDTSGWNFGFHEYGIGDIGNEFIISPLNNGNYTIDDSKPLITANYDESNQQIIIEYSELYLSLMSYLASFESPSENNNFNGTYNQYYVGSKDSEIEGVDLPYYTSPYYDVNIGGLEEPLSVNEYQDALEYAIYLFVLGYDYEVDGVESEDAPFFDFQIRHTDESGIMEPHVYVGGWGNDYIPISEALDRVKALYADVGSYVGLTAPDPENPEEESNLDQIKRFILDKIIGLEKDDDGNYVSTSTIQVTNSVRASNGYLQTWVDINGDGIVDASELNITDSATLQRDDISLDREYETVVQNILDYACDQVLIGGSDDNEPVNIDTPFPISQIVDYAGDYFSLNYEDENGNDDDSMVLRHIEEAEYQALSFKFLPEYIGENVTDIWLVFEYGYPEADQDPTKTYLDELVINIGFNVYDSETGTLTKSNTIQKTIKCGQAAFFSDYEAGIMPDQNAVYIQEDDIGDLGSDDTISIPGGIPIKMVFDDTMDNNVLNTAVSGTVTGDYTSVITINGDSDARNYYKLNNSTSYGQYGTFNEEMFFDKNDYFEIYFDVVKAKGIDSENINYGFKVGLWTLTTTADNNFEVVGDDFDEGDLEGLAVDIAKPKQYVEIPRRTENINFDS